MTFHSFNQPPIHHLFFVKIHASHGKRSEIFFSRLTQQNVLSAICGHPGQPSPLLPISGSTKKRGSKFENFPVPHASKGGKIKVGEPFFIGQFFSFSETPLHWDWSLFEGEMFPLNNLGYPIYGSDRADIWEIVVCNLKFIGERRSREWQDRSFVFLLW